MYFRVELTHHCGVLIAPAQLRREDWLFGRVAVTQVGQQHRMVKALELHPPRVSRNAPMAWLYKPEFLTLSGRSITFSGLEKASIHGNTAWVQQCWACVYADDGDFMRWARSLPQLPSWAVLLV